MTPEQMSLLELGKRSDGRNRDWVELYLAEFPVEEQRDVEQLSGYLASGEVVLHETRDQHGQLLSWSMSQDYPAPRAGKKHPPFWLGCWTVTRKSMQSSGIGRLHLPKVIEALKREKPGYIGRITEIESTADLPPTSQPVRRAKFYRALGMLELDVPYEIPLYQPVDAAEYVPQAKLGKSIKGQLLFAPFSNKPVTAKQVRSIISRIYKTGYGIDPKDPFMAQRLALIDGKRDNFLIPIRILGQDEMKPAV
jgi:hypothetical protein